MPQPFIVGRAHFFVYVIHCKSLTRFGSTKRQATHIQPHEASQSPKTSNLCPWLKGLLHSFCTSLDMDQRKRRGCTHTEVPTCLPMQYFDHDVLSDPYSNMFTTSSWCCPPSRSFSFVAVCPAAVTNWVWMCAIRFSKREWLNIIIYCRGIQSCWDIVRYTITLSKFRITSTYLNEICTRGLI